MKKGGWDTWIRTKIHGFKVRRSAVELYPINFSIVTQFFIRDKKLRNYSYDDFDNWVAIYASFIIAVTQLGSRGAVRATCSVRYELRLI